MLGERQLTLGKVKRERLTKSCIIHSANRISKFILGKYRGSQMVTVPQDLHHTRKAKSIKYTVSYCY